MKKILIIKEKFVVPTETVRIINLKIYFEEINDLIHNPSDIP